MRPSVVPALALAVVIALLGPVGAAPTKLTLEQVLAKAATSPKARMAAGDTDAAEARVNEANAARLPRGKATLYGTVSPEIRCDQPTCVTTSPTNFAFRFSGLYGSAQLEVTQPLYTFGKIAHARSAARAGLDAQHALEDEAAGDLAVDAARAYWGIKTARELGFMLDDGIEQIEAAVKRLDERTGKDAPSIQDRQRVAVLLAEARAQRADAGASERQALAGLRAITGIADADVDDVPLAAVEYALPARVNAGQRPQAVAARQGALAADELAAMARSQYFPDLALVATAVIARAQGVDDPPSAFANDPYNRTGLGAVLAMQWTLEPWSLRAKAGRARAEARKAHAQSDLAAVGAQYDAETAMAEATGARDRLAASTEGDKASRTWLAAVLQADAIGTSEPKDLADAYIAWFQMRARWAQAAYQWNVAVVRLGRAGGEFRAAPSRP
jgi:outer membrane protein TolC